MGLALPHWRIGRFALLGAWRCVKAEKLCRPVRRAAPSVALATNGAGTVVLEARSMMLGAIAFTTYSILVCQLLIRPKFSATLSSTTALLCWLVVAAGLCAIFSE